MDPSPADQRLRTVCLLLLTGIALGVVLSLMRAVMTPLVVALFVTMALTPLSLWLERRLGLRHGPAATLALILGVFALVLVGLLMTTAVAQISAYTGTYADRIRALLDRADDVIPVQRLGIDADQAREVVAGQIGSLAGGTARALLGLVSDGALVLVFTIFLMFGRRAWRPRAGGFWARFAEGTQRYMALKVITSAVTGLFVGLFLWILGVELAGVFGLLAFLLNFVPQIGSVVATLLPLPVVLFDPETTTATIVLVLAVPALFQMVIGSVVEPALLGNSVDLHPVAMLAGLVFWGVMWGFVGVLLAVPLTAFVKEVMARIEPLAPLADLMSSGATRTPAVVPLQVQP